MNMNHMLDQKDFWGGGVVHSLQAHGPTDPHARLQNSLHQTHTPLATGHAPRAAHLHSGPTRPGVGHNCHTSAHMPASQGRSPNRSACDHARTEECGRAVSHPPLAHGSGVARGWRVPKRTGIHAVMSRGSLQETHRSGGGGGDDSPGACAAAHTPCPGRRPQLTQRSEGSSSSSPSLSLCSRKRGLDDTEGERLRLGALAPASRAPTSPSCR